ncbi:MAG: DsrE family protein [Candidatus Methanomethylophilaceae archaeon]
MAQKIIVLIRKPPYGTEEAFAGARLALGGLVSGVITNADVLLMEDGTLNATDLQNPEAIGMPPNGEALQDIIDMGGEVFCVKEDLDLRIGDAKVFDGVKLVHRSDVRGIVDRYQFVNTF